MPPSTCHAVTLQISLQIVPPVMLSLFRSRQISSDHSSDHSSDLVGRDAEIAQILRAVAKGACARGRIESRKVLANHARAAPALRLLEDLKRCPDTAAGGDVVLTFGDVGVRIAVGVVQAVGAEAACGERAADAAA